MYAGDLRIFNVGRPFWVAGGLGVCSLAGDLSAKIEPYIDLCLCLAAVDVADGNHTW